jgi:hypothetical protein
LGASFGENEKMTTSKKLNPAAIIALKEALTHIY